MSQLRHLSVFVDEPDPGHYFWVLHESTEDANVWVNFASSDLDFPTWVEAYDSGTVELMRLVIDERTGPRAPGKDKDAALVPDGHVKLLHLWPPKLLQAGRADYAVTGVNAMRAAAS
ncbi:hypothetical protein WKW80_35665, partial [Variovorax humicola]